MSGRLRAVQHGARQDLIFTDMEAGAFFGELSAFDGAPRALSILAVNNSLVAKMPAAVFVETMFSHRPLGEAVIATLIARLRSTTRRVGELGALDVRGRLHAELLRLARPDREDPKRAIILAPPTQSELASRINTRRETVSREINAMERRGLIERRRGAIVITDALRLSANLEAVSRGSFDAGANSSPRRQASATNACVSPNSNPRSAKAKAIARRGLRQCVQVARRTPPPGLDTGARR